MVCPCVGCGFLVARLRLSSKKIPSKVVLLLVWKGDTAATRAATFPWAASFKDYQSSHFVSFKWEKERMKVRDSEKMQGVMAGMSKDCWLTNLQPRCYSGGKILISHIQCKSQPPTNWKNRLIRILHWQLPCFPSLSIPSYLFMSQRSSKLKSSEKACLRKRESSHIPEGQFSSH